MLTSKFSTTNHIIELFVALVHKPKTTSSIIKINIVANIIEQMLALHEPSPYLFTCQGRPLITDTFNKRLKKYTTEIDIPYLSTHKLRFTSASLAKNQGQCEQDIQHNLGHSNIQQTQHYDSHATTEYNYGMAADIYDKKYNVTKCNQTFEHKKIAPNLDKLKA